VKKQTKFIFVTGGVLSGLGKGISAASLGTILKARGFLVNIQKCDPYFNTDAGTLNPAEHGEVFVTGDGAETDLDLGHYERFLNQELTQSSSLMSGRVYAKVIADERAGKYLGKTVQIIPHITAEVQRNIIETGQGYDFHIVEIGGTVGDYESLGFLEGIRQMKRKIGAQNVAYVHLVYLPYLEASHELKTKPAQNAVRDLRALGIQPDVLMVRADRPVPAQLLNKLSIFCDVDLEGIVALPTVKTVYEVPLILEAAGIGDYITNHFGLQKRESDLVQWRSLVETIQKPGRAVANIGVVAKYMDHEDTYTSVFEALKSAAWANKSAIKISWVDAERLEEMTPREVATALSEYDGLVVPGGFGSRGVEGKVIAADYAIKNKLPYLGLCLGMQVAVIALARQVLGTKRVNSTEVDPETPNPVIHIMEDQSTITEKGGTMRLGNYPCKLSHDSLSFKAYKNDNIVERHRHRFELNNDYREVLTKAGLRLAGTSPDDQLVEIIEMKNHPFMVASQFHPEFKSRPAVPHPLFADFIKATLKAAKGQVVANKSMMSVE
jgi:CTP synthase